jgi:TonB-dependent starch-binding outer membrane protein SusC
MLGTRRSAQFTFAVAVLAAAVACSSGTQAPETSPAPVATDSVSVGYGRIAKRDVTGAVASVSGADISEQRVARVEELLRGRVAGVEVVPLPNGDFSLRIRNASSNGANSAPLIILDGMPLPRGGGVGSALSGIAPSDIARIEILKDAGSAAAYGSDGANGVVLITTKRRQ